METELTPGVRRVLEEAARWSFRGVSGPIEAPAVVLGLLAESECRGAILLGRWGVDRRAVCVRWPGLVRGPGGAGPLRFSADVAASLEIATERLQSCVRPVVLATEHLLLGLAAGDHETGDWLRRQGVDPDGIQREISARYGELPNPEPGRVVPLEMPEEPGGQPVARPVPVETPDVGPAGERTAVLRVIDAAANRAREGLRVVEDYVRFVLDDVHLTGLLKGLRHRLDEALRGLPWDQRMAARETQADVGTQLSTHSEKVRTSAADVLAANLTRFQESLRTLEEFTKVLAPSLAGPLEQLRYRAYTVQRAVETTRTSAHRLANARLYVLIDARPTEDAFRQLVGTLVDAGADVIQLRDKRLDDRQLLDRARVARELTRGSQTLLVINDRPDVAAVAQADGVHLGQEDLAVKDARALIGPEALIGVSAHSIQQARQAVLDGANYLGVGPTFPSQTKHFDEFPGLDLVRAVAAEIRLPAFAIGGITEANLPRVLAAGIRRVAVSGAVATAPDPAAAVQSLKAALKTTGPSDHAR